MVQNKKVLIVEDQFIEANDLQLMLGKAGYEVCGIARSVPIAQEMIKKEGPGLVLLDIFLKGKQTGIDLAKQLSADNIAFIYLSANSNEEILAAAKETEPYGFIVKPFREKDLLVTLEIAQYRHEHSRESKYRRESELIKQLERLLSGQGSLNEKLLHTAEIVQQEIPFEYMTFSDGSIEKSISFLRTGYNEYQMISIEQLTTITGVSLSQLRKIPAGKETVAAIFNNEDFENSAQQLSPQKLVREKFQMKSLLTYPLIKENGEAGNFSFYSRRPDIYSTEHITLLHRLQPTLFRYITQTPVVENAIHSIKSTRREESGIKNSRASAFRGIVGNSHLLLNVFDQLTQVAPFDTSVLVLGESGTGKERIADCIHNLSPRKGKPFIKVNCATLPATLIESELFGHEKGSFTGATDKRTGKFEQANGGTIFLDEIGEMPVDLQVKLLRVLQEKEIESIGSRSPVRVNVRFIAATNRNLEKEVAEGRFRLDLYYRLNVFPILLPSLRERAEDIPVLAEHFIAVFNQKSGKRINGLSDKALNNMLAYGWPGNIRELEHLIERSVLLAKGSIIEDIFLPATHRMDHAAEKNFPVKSIHDNERDYIINILKKCNGKIWGSGGAAEILNIPPSTLKSKMKKLGIQKENNT